MTAPDRLPIGERFARFHAANPHVYDRLVELAREWKRRRGERVGIGMLFEVLRWEVAMQTSGDEFRLNNDFRSYYARLIMQREGDLAGIFETRRSRVDLDDQDEREARAVSTQTALTATGPPAEQPADTDPQTAAEIRAEIDRTTRLRMAMSGDEFLERISDGRLDRDDPRFTRLLGLARLLPDVLAPAPGSLFEVPAARLISGAYTMHGKADE